MLDGPHPCVLRYRRQRLLMLQRSAVPETWHVDGAVVVRQAMRLLYDCTAAICRRLFFTYWFVRSLCTFTWLLYRACYRSRNIQNFTGFEVLVSPHICSPGTRRSDFVLPRLLYFSFTACWRVFAKLLDRLHACRIADIIRNLVMALFSTCKCKCKCRFIKRDYVTPLMRYRFECPVNR